MTSTALTEYSIPYGRSAQSLRVPARQVAGVCMPRPLSACADPLGALRASIDAGLQATGIAAKARRGQRACIVVTDRTRSTPNAAIVPILLDRLNQMGIPDDDITLLIGLGMHAADNQDAILANVGRQVVERVAIFNNEPDNSRLMQRLGQTALGAPVEVHQRYAEADIRIGTGVVNPCMLAGWSAGGKIVLPGVSSRRCIYENHKRFTATLAALGCGSLMGVMPPDNAVRADIEDAAAIGGLDMVVDVLLDNDRRLIAAHSGDQIAAQRAAVEQMRPYVEVRLPQRVDILVAGVGEVGYECSLFQGGSRVCGGVDRYLNDGGELIMVNECREGIYEGFEHELFRQWMRDMPAPAEIRRLTEQMAIGGEKSCVLYTFSWLLRQKQCRLTIVTGNMTPAELSEIHLGHAAHVQTALDAALQRYGSSASIGIMPYAGLVLPVL
jgi:nickel-dependent lactate racemase